MNLPNTPQLPQSQQQSQQQIDQNKDLNMLFDQSQSQLNPQQQLLLLQQMKSQQRNMQNTPINSQVPINIQLLQLQQQRERDQQRFLYNFQQPQQNNFQQPQQTILNQQQKVAIQQQQNRGTPLNRTMNSIQLGNGVHASPQFSNPATPKLPMNSPPLNNNLLQSNSQNNPLGSPPNAALLYANQMRTQQLQAQQNLQSIQNPQERQAMMAQQLQQMGIQGAMNQRSVNQVLANFQQAQQHHNPNQINLRPQSNVQQNTTNNGDGSQRRGYELPKGPPNFPIAPQQSTRCFFTQPMHGLVDPPTPFGYPQNSQQGSKIESSSIFMSREQADEPSPVVAPPHSTKRKLHVLLSQLNPTIQLEPDTEQVLLRFADYFVEQVTHGACKIAKHCKTPTLQVKDIQLELERNWNIRIPGYPVEILPHKPLSNSVHLARLAAIAKQRREEQNEVELLRINREMDARELMAKADTAEELESDEDQDIVDEDQSNEDEADDNEISQVTVDPGTVENEDDLADDGDEDIADDGDNMASGESLESGSFSESKVYDK